MNLVGKGKKQSMMHEYGYVFKEYFCAYFQSKTLVDLISYLLVMFLLKKITKLYSTARYQATKRIKLISENHIRFLSEM